MLARDAVHLVDGLDHVHRDADGAGLIRDGARDGLADPPGGIGRELEAATEFELVHRLHQADVAFLDQVQELQAAVGVLLRNGNHQAQVGLDHFLLGIAREAFAVDHALVDVLQFFQRHHDALLQVDQALLQLLHRRNVASERGAPGFAGSGLLLHPLQVEQVVGEFGHELFLRHVALVHDDLAQQALVLAHFLDLFAHGVAQLFDGLGREADGHQPAADFLLRLHVGRRAVAVLLVGGQHGFEAGADVVKTAQRLVLDHFHHLGLGLGAAVVIVVDLVFVLFGHVVVVLVGIGKAVDDGRDHDLVFTDFVCHGEDLVDGGGGSGNGFHHVHHAALDALGDLDLAFAREQLDRAHFAHVHAHRVGGTAEFVVHVGQGGLGFFLGLFLGGSGAGGVVQQQGFGIGRLFIDGHAHVAQHGDHDFQRFGIDQLVGQVVGNFRVGQVAARLAQLDQLLQALAAGGDFLFGQDGFVQPEFLHQRALLGLGELHAQRLDFLDGGSLLGRGFFCHFLFGEFGFDVAEIFVEIVALGLAATLGGSRGLGSGRLGLAGCCAARGGFLGSLGGFGRVFGGSGRLGARAARGGLDGFDGFGRGFFSSCLGRTGGAGTGSLGGRFGHGFGLCRRRGAPAAGPGGSGGFDGCACSCSPGCAASLGDRGCCFSGLGSGDRAVFLPGDHG